MKQVIPFSKDIVFKTNIASITSISLEHEEKISDGEISGDFIVFGDYKIHNDTTERELFRFKLPFTTLIPDNVIPSTISIDVENFTYEIIEEDVLKVNINFSIEGDEEDLEKRMEEDLKDAEEQEKIENQNENEFTNELNFFLDEKIISNIANMEELREKSNDQMLKEFKNEESEEPVSKEEQPTENSSINHDIEELLSPSVHSLTERNTTEVKRYIEKSEENKEDRSYMEEPVANKEETKLEETIITNNLDQTKTPAIEASRIEKEGTSTSERETKDSEEQKNMINEQTMSSEYVTYHIHIVKIEETLDTIIKNYNSNLDILGLYNDVSNIKVGDKLIIPQYLDE